MSAAVPDLPALAGIPEEAIVPLSIQPVTFWGTDDPREIVAKATAVADALADVVRTKKLSVQIGSNEHVKVEGWTLLGSLVGVFPHVEWSRPIRITDKDGNTEQVGWEARAQAITAAGKEVGAAESMCTTREANWKSRDGFQIRSMAQTRAIAKALRLPLGFIMQLAGYDATPAEEMQ